jgi:hypothetical protein
MKRNEALRKIALDRMNKQDDSTVVDDGPNILDSGMTPNPTEAGARQRQRQKQNKKTTPKKNKQPLSKEAYNMNLAEQRRAEKKRREREAMKAFQRQK